MSSWSMIITITKVTTYTITIIKVTIFTITIITITKSHHHHGHLAQEGQGQ